MLSKAVKKPAMKLATSTTKAVKIQGVEPLASLAVDANVVASAASGWFGILHDCPRHPD